jgi:hypothetical protein
MDLVAARTADLSGSLSSDRLIVARKGRWAGCGTKTVQGSNRFERAQRAALTLTTTPCHSLLNHNDSHSRNSLNRVSTARYPVPTPFSPPNSIHQNSPTSSGRGRLNYKLSST